MSSAPEGWYVDPSTGTNLRYWDGSTWTDEVAPLPYKRTHSGPVALFGPAEPMVTAPEPVAEAASTDSSQAVPENSAEPGDLDPDVERTRISRRELRARRGSDAEPADTAKHSSLMTPPAAVATEESSEPVELEIPAAPTTTRVVPQTQGLRSARRPRVARILVLLAILALATVVAALLVGVL